MSSVDTQKEFRYIADRLVTAMVGSDLAPKWWCSPNRAFDGRTPEQQWVLGSDQVINYLMHHVYVGGGS